MRDHLEMPLELSGVCVQRQSRIGIQIVTLAHVAIPIRRGIAGAPDNQILVDIVRTSDPGGPAAMLPGITAPCLGTWFARRGNCPKPPAALTRRGIVGVDEAANAV